MVSYVQVLGTGITDAPPSVFLFTDKRRYLFNCGEGSQRFASEHRIRLAKLDTVFLTDLSWEAVGGLPGTRAT